MEGMPAFKYKVCLSATTIQHKIHDVQHKLASKTKCREINILLRSELEAEPDLDMTDTLESSDSDLKITMIMMLKILIEKVKRRRKF